ncbi:uncharacterized protein lrrc53 isoform X2 [Oreochromis aureus]|uniref:uncharacterized protein lrrc53 isoform X2 n=1 Tax=Oreochromis aureus TaxID=47969 RepID=UPI001952A907|nr:uncharacterized protein lrrc53 isoform X2 [Oreochromis aureus]CAI5642248.1 unnamed protein product [Mustela putorius furo]
MYNILRMLLLLVISAQHMSQVPLCPASCMVCSEDAVICQRLTKIIVAPNTTQALLLTEGSISTVQPASLSELSNITVIGLSHNNISELARESFRNLPFLHTLLLDHNLLNSESLQGGALMNLTQLQVLTLGHNIISMIQGGWFKGAKALQSLTLEGNLLTSLDSGSFPLNDLRELRNLDLSDNLIQHVDRNRNRLSSAPVDAFSYLTWLTNLNLDLNSWNCSCQLLELADFLSTFIQQPDKILYNGRRMVCASADNPAVTTVLELTDANCVPSNQNITVHIEPRASVTPQLYARDLAITAVICFIGGVGLTLLIVLIYYQVSRKKKMKESKRLKEQEEGSSSTANHCVNHLDVRERRRDVFLQENSRQQWNKDAMTLDTWANEPGDQFRFRTDENSGCFSCPDCSSDAPQLNPVRRENRMNGGIEAKVDRERRKIRRISDEEGKRTEVQHRILNRDTPNKFVFQENTNSSSYPQSEAFSQRAEILPACKNGRNVNNHRTHAEVKIKGYESLRCESCHRTYRAEQDMRQRKIGTNPGDFALPNGFSSQYRLNERGRNAHNHSDMMKNTELKRVIRNVSFDLQSSRTLEEGNSQIEDKREEEVIRDKRKRREKRQKVQSSRLVKVKLNLNPLRKSKVHPRKKIEQGPLEKSSSKKSKEKRTDGKECEEKKEKGKSSEKKMRKSCKTETLTEDGNKEEEVGGEEGQKSQTLSEKTTSKSDNSNQKSTEESRYPENNQSVQSSSAADQSGSAIVSGHGQSLLGNKYQGAGLTLGSAQHSSTNLSLLGSAGSQLNGSSLSLQGGNFLLSTLASGSKLLFPRGPAPSIAFSGPNMASSGAPDMLSRQAAGGVLSAANPFHVSATPQTGGAPLNLAANPGVNPAAVQSASQSPMLPDSAPLVAKPKPEPAQGQVIQNAGLHQLSVEPQAPTTKENLPASQDCMSEDAPKRLEPVSTVENISISNSQAETRNVPVGTMVDISVGVVAQTEVPAVERYGASMQEAGISGVSVPGISTESESSTAAALLQQEYLPEEGGSPSLRRKLRLVLPEKTSSRPLTALERKIR